MRAEDLEELTTTLSKHQRLLKMVFHDLEAPLRAIKSYGKFIEEDVKPKKNTETGCLFDSLNRSTVQLGQQIKGLKEVVRLILEPLSPSETNCQVLVDDIAHKLTSDIDEFKARITTTMLPTLFIDAQQLSLVIRQIIDNALKYNAQVERIIDISCSVTHEKDLTTSVFRVVDNGIGIKSNQVASLFEPFGRAHGNNNNNGVGLGLTVCQIVVTKNNGSIKIVPNNTVGSTVEFSVTTPRIGETVH